jgi:phage protein U
MVRREAPTHDHFHCAPGLCTRTLACQVNSLVRVSRRVARDHYANIRARRRVPQSVAGRHLRAITLRGATFPLAVGPAAN